MYSFLDTLQRLTATIDVGLGKASQVGLEILGADGKGSDNVCVKSDDQASS